MAEKHGREVIEAEENREYIPAEKIEHAKKFMERSKILLLSVFGAAVLVGLLLTGLVNSYLGYEYSYNGKVLGIVKDKEEVLRITDLVQDALTQENEIQVVIDKEDDISFKRVAVTDYETIDTSEEVLRRLTYMGDINVKAYTIMVNGRRTAVVESEEQAEEVLEQIREEFTSGGQETIVEEADFVEQVEIRETNSQLQNVQTTKEAKAMLKTGAIVEKEHVVIAGETLDELAERYDTTEAEIKELNPEIDEKKLEVGNKITVRGEEPMVTLKTSELVTYTEPISYETQEKESDEIYEGDTEVKTKGKKGIREITARVVKENGKESAKVPLVTRVEKEPVTKVVLVGTKERPPTIGDGEYIWPVQNYRLTSPFGARWGRNHNGLDLAVPTGTEVVAADGGTVTFAGYKGSFGYLVIIDHQNGEETYYAHNSRLVVQAGDKVYEGQQVAESGSTGRSTGPHCHFEIRVNGTPTDPAKRLP